MKKSLLAFAVACVFVFACIKVGYAPSVEQLQRDLVGRDFCYEFTWNVGGRRWSVKEGEVKEVVPQHWKAHTTFKTSDIPALVTISDGERTIRGMLVFRYRKIGHEWKLAAVTPRDAKPGKSYSFEVTVSRRD